MKQYSCKNCGAILYWNPESSCLECEYCLSKYQVSDFEEEIVQEEGATKEKETIEPEKADEYATATDESDSDDLVVYKCSNCNAELVTARSTVATTCAFCGEAISITDKLVDNFKPDYVIPFEITKEKAEKLYKEHIKKGILTPKDFSRKNELEKMKGVYAPFWLHSFRNDVNAVVYGEKIASTFRRGYDKVNVYNTYDVQVQAEGTFENIPTDALKKIDNKLMDAVEPFEYKNLQEFSPAYMAGYYAEEYGEDSVQTIQRAEERANETMKQQILSGVKGYSDERVSSFYNSVVNAESHYAMLPVWLFYTKYNGKDYTFAVNGQTGKTAGELPWSKKILTKYAVLMFVATQLIALVIRIIGVL